MINPRGYCADLIPRSGVLLNPSRVSYEEWQAEPWKPFKACGRDTVHRSLTPPVPSDEL